eukprot:GFUD01070657.1.p1 GENE.GFUD01070657.1~~GFUD01070657.1.p1  ORF type:complete len:110 (+),score=7.56 GFUD01070657.1:26-331(+)
MINHTLRLMEQTESLQTSHLNAFCHMEIGNLEILVLKPCSMEPSFSISSSNTFMIPAGSFVVKDSFFATSQNPQLGSMDNVVLQCSHLINLFAYKYLIASS